MEGGWVDCGQWHTVAILAQARVPACSLEKDLMAGGELVLLQDSHSRFAVALVSRHKNQVFTAAVVTVPPGPVFHRLLSCCTGPGSS